MLQLGDQSLLETVVRNVVVFSRMKSHQKGQVMELLGSQGLHQVITGQQQHLFVSHLLNCPPTMPPLPPAPFISPSVLIAPRRKGSIL